MKINELYDIFLQYPSVTTDSRKIEKDDIFFALKGKNFNGNQYAKQALEDGCSYAVVDEEKYATGKRYILVDNVLTTLQELAKFHRAKLNTPILAITGSNGKTTTKELIGAVLNERYNTLITKGNFNNHIGVPLTLLRLSADTQFGIIEMGANHTGEIKRLCEITQPNYGIITNIGTAHIEGFGSFEGVKKAKSELYDYMKENNGIIFYNADNEILKSLITTQDKFSYGSSEEAFYKGKLIKANPFVSLRWTNNPNKKLSSIKWIDNNKYIKAKLIGTYNFENIMAAISVGAYLGVPDTGIKSAIERYKPANNRSQMLKTGKNILYLDAYNANPTSMHAALENFGQMKTSSAKTVILGDMLELGNVSEQEHMKIIAIAENQEFENIFLIGNNFCKITSTLPQYKGNCFTTTDDFMNFILKNPLKDQHILLKASRGIQLEKIIEYL